MFLHVLFTNRSPRPGLPHQPGSILPHLPLLVLASTLFFALGHLAYVLEAERLGAGSAPLVSLSEKRGLHCLSGQVIRCPLPAEEGVHLIVAVRGLHTPASDVSLSGSLSLMVRGLRPRDLAPGDLIRFAATLRPIRNFQTPGQFDRETWWATRGICVTGLVDHPLRLAVEGHGGPSQAMPWPRYILEKARADILDGLRRHLTQPALGLCTALLLGEQTDLSPEVREAFSKTGIGHLLAVSGLHMALVALLTGGLANWLLLRSSWLTLRLPVRKVATIIALAGTVFYAALAGLSPSAVRATVMVLAFGGALLMDRPQTPINALALAAWVLLVAEPLNLFAISFQLSFLAVFFLILSMPAPLKTQKAMARIEEGGVVRRRALKPLLDLLLVTLIATAATAPLIAWHFQRISLISPLANLVFVPLTSLVILPCLLTAALLWPFAPSLAGALWHSLGFLITPMAVAVGHVASWPLAAIWTARPSITQVVLAYLLLGTLAIAPKKRCARCAAGLFLAGLVLVSGLQAWSRGRDPRLSLHVLDVGQGTCQVVEFPGGDVMVSDAGGLPESRFDIGAMVVAPFLRAKGKTRIDILIASHPEQDHIGGLAALVEQFSVGELWTTGDAARTDAWERLLSACGRRGVRHVIWRSPGRVQKGSVAVEILPPEHCPKAVGNNARSLVVGLAYGERRLLLPGDIDSTREECLVAQGLGPQDVVVVPHHGSKTSSGRTFIEATGPEVAIVPVGWRNSWGLPNKEVLSRYREAGARLLRTDQDGTVTIRTDGRFVEVGSFRQTKGR